MQRPRSRGCAAELRRGEQDLVEPGRGRAAAPEIAFPCRSAVSVVVTMEIVAHGLWTAAAAITAKRSLNARARAGWTVWWGVFPDVLAFGPMMAAGLWFRLAGAPVADGRAIPHVHIGVPLYPAAHSLIVFLLVFTITTLLARRIVFAMLGWLLHILIDIPTHSLRYYATRFLWPLTDFRVDGIAWWTLWFWVATYGALAAVYCLMWKKGWLARERLAPQATAASTAVGEDTAIPK